MFKENELNEVVMSAARNRFCPNVKLLMEKVPSEELKRHLKKCPFCRETLANNEEALAWEELSELVNETTLSNSTPDEVLPGQIWTVAEKYSGWGVHDLYYHVPQVVVLSVYPYSVVRVAQISSFPALARNGDVLLDTVPTNSFAEMWNQYSLPAQWLDVCIGKISGRRLGVLHLAEHLHEEIKEGSLIDKFRQQELIHSSHFAMGAMEEVMRLGENFDEDIDEVRD